MPSPVSIIGGYYRDPNLHWSRQDCLNWIPVRAERNGALTEWQLRDAPGLKPAVQIHDGSGGIRGARNVEGKLFVVTGNQLYQITNKGVAIPRGVIPGVGRVSMAHNASGLGNELLTVNGSAGYVYNTNTKALARVTDPGYPGAFVADFVDQYLPQVEPQGRYWFISDLSDAHAYNTLDQYMAEGDPDRIVSLLVSHREVLVFGADSIEPYVNVGSQTGTFARASNTVIECGCSARFSPRRMDNSAFWLDDNRLVRRLDGYNPVILSTEAISGAFRECTQSEISQAYAFTWEDAGHKVYYITVPGRFTFGYDAKTGEWHRRSSYGLPHWAVSEIVQWNGRWYACDSRYPRLYELDPNYKMDGCSPLERERTAGAMWADANQVTLNELELLFNTGGPDTVCVPFPAQPQGPSISGAAPDGLVGVAYPGYTYTVTPGDAPIASVTVVSGSAPTGLTISNGEINTGTPTDGGEYTFTILVEDRNGLYASLTDTVTIGAVWFARRISAGDSLGRSDGGTDWTTIPLSDTGSVGGRFLVYGDGKLVAYGNNDLGYSTDLGLTFTEVLDPPQSSGPGYRAVYAHGKFWFPCGNNGLKSSADLVTFDVSPIDAGNDDDYTVCFASGFGLRAGLYGQARSTTDGGATWGEVFQVLVSPRSALSSATDGQVIVVGGHDFSTNVGAMPFIKGSNPSHAVREISGLAYGNGTWVAVASATDDGPRAQIAFCHGSPTGEWTLVDKSFASAFTNVEFVAGLFVAVGLDGMIETSPDGENWTTRANNFGSDAIYSVTAAG